MSKRCECDHCKDLREQRKNIDELLSMHNNKTKTNPEDYTIYVSWMP